MARKAMMNDGKQMMGNTLKVEILYHQLEQQSLLAKYQLSIIDLPLSTHNHQIYSLLSPLKLHPISLQLIKNNSKNSSFCVLQFGSLGEYEKAMEGLEGIYVKQWKQKIRVEKYQGRVEELTLEKQEQVQEVKQKLLDVEGQEYEGEVLGIDQL